MIFASPCYFGGYFIFKKPAHHGHRAGFEAALEERLALVRCANRETATWAEANPPEALDASFKELGALPGVEMHQVQGRLNAAQQAEQRAQFLQQHQLDEWA